jgi:hypothetical protein
MQCRGRDVQRTEDALHFQEMGDSPVDVIRRVVDIPATTQRNNSLIKGTFFNSPSYSEVSIPPSVTSPIPLFPELRKVRKQDEAASA